MLTLKSIFNLFVGSCCKVSSDTGYIVNGFCPHKLLIIICILSTFLVLALAKTFLKINVDILKDFGLKYLKKKKERKRKGRIKEIQQKKNEEMFLKKRLGEMI